MRKIASMIIASALLAASTPALGHQTAAPDSKQVTAQKVRQNLITGYRVVYVSTSGYTAVWIHPDVRVATRQSLAICRQNTPTWAMCRHHSTTYGTFWF